MFVALAKVDNMHSAIRTLCTDSSKYKHNDWSFQYTLYLLFCHTSMLKPCSCASNHARTSMCCLRSMQSPQLQLLMDYDVIFLCQISSHKALTAALLQLSDICTQQAQPVAHACSQTGHDRTICFYNRNSVSTTQTLCLLQRLNVSTTDTALLACRSLPWSGWLGRSVSMMRKTNM